MNKERIKFLVLFIIYFIAVVFDPPSWMIGNYSTILTPSSGVALAFFLLYGRRFWALIFTAALVGYYISTHELILSSFFAVGSTLEGLLGAYLLRKTKFNLTLDLSTGSLRFILVSFSIPIASVIFKIIGAPFLEISSPNFFTDLSTWWLSDFIGNLQVAPFFLMWTYPPLFSFLEKKKELVAFFFSLFAFICIIFLPIGSPIIEFIKRFGSFPLVIWAVFSFNIKGGITTTILLSLTAVFAANQHIWPFQTTSFPENIITLQFTLIITTIFVLILSSALKEQHKTLLALEKASIKALEGTKLKSIFLANLSHEIRTPMYGIIGMSELLKKTTLAEDQKEYVTTLQGSAKLLLRILNDILDFSLVETGKYTIKAENFDLKSLLNDVITSASPEAEKKQLPVNLNINPNVPLNLQGDPIRLKQILTNLLINAIKFTHHGEISLEVTEKKGENEKLLILFKIHDTGIGISPTDKALLFSPFVRLEVSSETKGTGLGLAISKILTELMGGQIGVDSIIGQGSTFWVIIPFNKQSLADQRLELSKPIFKNTVPIKGSSKILVVEDDLINQKVISLQLKKMGFVAEVVGGGFEALDKLKNEPYGLILMDCLMPTIDGFTTTQEIRRREGPNQHTPIIAMTAYQLEGSQDKCFQVGMNDYLAKPVIYDDLEKKVTSYLTEKAPVIFSEVKREIIDLDALYKLVGNDPHATHHLIKMFYKQITTQLEKIKQSIKEQNDLELIHLAKNGITQSQALNCFELENAFRELCVYAKEHQFEEARLRCTAMASTLNAIITYCEQHLSP